MAEEKINIKSPQKKSYQIRKAIKMRVANPRLSAKASNSLRSRYGNDLLAISPTMRVIPLSKPINANLKRGQQVVALVATPKISAKGHHINVSEIVAKGTVAHISAKAIVVKAVDNQLSMQQEEIKKLSNCDIKFHVIE